jgi:hypothetical protein
MKARRNERMDLEGKTTSRRRQFLRQPSFALVFRRYRIRDSIALPGILTDVSC